MFMFTVFFVSVLCCYSGVVWLYAIVGICKDKSFFFHTIGFGVSCALYVNRLLRIVYNSDLQAFLGTPM